MNRVDAADASVECLTHIKVCSLGEGTDPSEVLDQTNDKQFIGDGEEVSVVPIYMVRNFKEQIDGRQLSDHTGFEVTYKLIWKEGDDGGIEYEE